MSSGMAIGINDPRYVELAGLTHPEQGRAIEIHAGQFDPSHNQTMYGTQWFKNPGNVHNGDGFFAYSDDNETADTQDRANAGMEDWQKALFAISLFAGGALGAGALGADAAVAGAAPGMSTSIGGGFGTGALGAGGTGASFGTAFSAANAAGAAGGAANAAAGDVGGINYETLPNSQVPQANAMGPDFSAGSGSLFGSSGNESLLGRAGNWAMNNPLRVIGLAQTASGLLGRGGNSGGSPPRDNYNPTSSYHGKGGQQPGQQPQQGHQGFYVNPITLAQLQRSYGAF